MSFLAKVQTGIQKSANLSVIFGQAGVGKSSFIAKAPSVLVIDIETSTSNLDLARLTSEDVPDYDTLVATLNELLTTKHDYKAIAIDSATTLEHYINQKVCIENGGVKDISEISFGKGPHLSQAKLKEFLTLLTTLKNKKGFDIWIVAHAMIRKHSDPILMQSFDRHTIQSTNEKFGQEIIRVADNVFFCRYSLDIAVDKLTRKAKGVGDASNREMLTRWAAGHDGKNRLCLPEVLPLDYDKYVEALNAFSPKSSEGILADIKAAAAQLESHDPELVTLAKEKVTEANGNNQKLQRVKEKLLDALKLL